ncbi:retron Ec78 anti-phage system effector HNH endonuclease PtuB [Pseudomonas fluorescens]|nr:retron Ec78 anti-phage system effector HNH endonuclease PtuB [Pseudomonas fluorescens]
MRKLQRGSGPGCLSLYQHGRHNWGCVTSEHRAEIWRDLNTMQGGRCAYCEAPINESDRHIEHFRQKGRDPRVTFEWENLFGSCNRHESCGKHKDRCAYAPLVLIKPDCDDPDDYWVFVSDGTIRPRADLSTPQQSRAEESLRIFNLDARNGRLRHMRREAVRQYLDTAEILA